MSEHEFEQFLAIFRGMLRLNPEQRDEIAAELMDHLQERLAELTARGMSRERAVQVALEEFGDAAGLAAQFLLIVSQQRRRRIMKWTAASVMTAMVVLYGAYAFWPAEPVRGPGAAPAFAQEKPAPVDNKKKKKVVVGTNPTVATKNDPTSEVEQQLAEKIAASFDQVPLTDFLERIGTEAKVDFYLNKAALEEAGIGTDSTITVNLKSIRIDKMLDLALAQHELVWIPRDGYVFVTTRENLERQLETRVYNCRDLVEPTWPGAYSAEGAGMGMSSMSGSEEAMGSAAGGGFGGMPGMAGMPGGMGMGAPGASGMGGMGMGGMSGMSGGMSGMSGGMAMGMMPGGAAPAMGGSGMAATGGMMGGPPGMGVPQGMAGMGVTSHMATLIQVITTTVMPDSWAQSGGPGSVAAYHGGLLVISQHAQAHRKVDQLLRMLREASKEHPGSVVRERY